MWSLTLWQATKALFCCRAPPYVKVWVQLPPLPITIPLNSSFVRLIVLPAKRLVRNLTPPPPTTTTRHTKQIPFSARLIYRYIDAVVFRRQVDLGAVVRPWAKLHGALLVVERKPLDVDGAGGNEQSERNPRHFAVAVDDRVGRKLAVDVFVRTGNTHARRTVKCRRHLCGGYNYDSTAIRRPFDCLSEVIKVSDVGR